MKTRTIVVSRAEVGRPVGLVLKQHLGLTWSQVRRLIERRRVRQGPGLCKDAQDRVRLGQKVRVRLEEGESQSDTPTPSRRNLSPPAPSPTRGGGPGGRGNAGRAAQVALPFADRHLVVADKPA